MRKCDNEEKIVCPFYKYHGVQTIVCEGMIIRSNVSHAFMDRGAKAEHFEQFCCSLERWNRCAYAKELMRRYDEK